VKSFPGTVSYRAGKWWSKYHFEQVRETQAVSCRQHNLSHARSYFYNYNLPVDQRYRRIGVMTSGLLDLSLALKGSGTVY